MDRMEKLGVWIAKNPLMIAAVAILMTIASVNFASQIQMHGLDTEDFVSTNSPLYEVYNHLYLENFGTQSIAILVEGSDVTNEDVLKAMLRFTERIKTEPNVVDTASVADIVADAEAEQSGVRQIPSQDEIDAILTEVNPDQLQSIMPDNRHTLISVVEPGNLNDAQQKDVLTETQAAVQFADFPPGYNIIVTGSPALTAAITSTMSSSQVELLALSGILMVVALLLVFRHVKWPLLPIPTVFLGIIWTFGAMGLLKLPITLISFSAFPILIGIGIDYAIQFHNRLDEEFVKGTPPVQAMANTVNHVAMPVLIALTVTGAGFISLISSSVPMVRQFGILCFMGLIMCYLSALFVGMTVLYGVEKRGHGKRNPDKKNLDKKNPDKKSQPELKKGEGREDRGSSIGLFLARIADFSIQRWQLILAVALLLALAGNYADTKVQVETNTNNYIPQDLPPLVQFRHLTEIFGGTDSLQFLIRADDVTDPSLLKWMDDFGNYISRTKLEVYGVTDLATAIEQANGGELPDNRTAIRAIINSMPATTRDRYINGYTLTVMNVNLGNAQANLGSEGIDRMIRNFDRDLAFMPPPPRVSVTVTGQLVVFTTIIGALTTGRTETTLIGLALIFLLLFLIYRGDLIKALLPVLPMLVVIGWMGGVMYLAGLKYTPLTATLGALILGVGSEYAILMMGRFYEELPKENDPLRALNITASRIGSALIASGMTVVFGFAALITSPFSITSNFGLVTVMAVLFALLTTFTVFVVLMINLEERRSTWEKVKLRLQRALRLASPGGE
ncbi:MAG: RND family transporter [Methanotrichaceae archaeon]